MARKKVSMETDFKKVQSLYKKGELEESFAKVDSNNVLKSLETVPLGPLRMMIALLSEAKVDEKIDRLGPDQSKPARALLEVAKKGHVRDFLNAMTRAVGKQRDVRKALGIGILSIQKTYDSVEAKIDSTVTDVVHTPLLVLSSLQLYVEMAFMQGDKLLFRSDMEIDDVLGLARKLLSAVESALRLTKEKSPGVEPKLEFDRCQAHMKNVRGVMGKLSSLLKEFEPKKKSKRPARAKKTTTKRKPAK